MPIPERARRHWKHLLAHALPASLAGRHLAMHTHGSGDVPGLPGAQDCSLQALPPYSTPRWPGGPKPGFHPIPTRLSASHFQPLKERSLGYPQICHFHMLIILDSSYLRNRQCQRDTQTLLCPLKAGNQSPSLHQEEERQPRPKPRAVQGRGACITRLLH